MRRGRNGFTLLELILVAAMLGVLAAVTVPGFVQSIRGNRLRTAARRVVSSGRYARSMAVLKQRRMGIFFDLKENTVAVRPAESDNELRDPYRLQELSPGGEATADSDEDLGEDSGIRPVSVDATGGTVNSDSPGAELNVSRELEDVQIQYVETDEGAQRFVEGQCSVVYEANGRCSPYTVMLEGEHGDGLVIDVDALASAEVNEVP